MAKITIRDDSKMMVCYDATNIEVNELTKDGEFTEEELKGILYDDIHYGDVKNIDWLMDNQDLLYTENLMEATINKLGGNLVEYYDKIYDEVVDTVFDIYSKRVIDTARQILVDNKSKLYVE